MTYIINEGSLGITPNEDRSINIVGLGRQHEVPLTLVVTRDVLEAGENLAGAVARQVKALSRQVQAFKEHVRREDMLGVTRLPAVLLETSFKQAGQPTHQCQAIAELAEGKLLIFTLSSPKPIDDRLREQWLALLGSFKPA